MKKDSASVERKYLSVQQAQQITNISAWTWRRKAYAGQIESVKVGTRLLIPATEIDRVIAEGTRPRATVEAIA
jgi:excisionase family DNA binding protein